MKTCAACSAEQPERISALTVMLSAVLAVGEGQETMFKVLDYAPGMLPDDKPRYLMGVGRPDDIVGAVLRGVDMFDCVMPTRTGRTSQAFTRSRHD